MSLRVAQSLATAGIIPTLAAIVAGGDSYSNEGNPFVWIKNNSVGSLIVTVAAVNPCNAGALHDEAVTVAAGAEKFLGPYSTTFYADTNLLVHLTYSGDTADAEIAVFLAP